jgi:very-short-patch-repair endonuclease
VYDEYNEFVARVDLAWPEVGVFYELDGESHREQPVYDAGRESAVVAATGWLCMRSTWTEVRLHPADTARKLARVIARARTRPVAT